MRVGLLVIVHLTLVTNLGWNTPNPIRTDRKWVHVVVDASIEDIVEVSEAGFGRLRPRVLFPPVEALWRALRLLGHADLGDLGIGGSVSSLKQCRATQVAVVIETYCQAGHPSRRGQHHSISHRRRRQASAFDLCNL